MLKNALCIFLLVSTDLLNLEDRGTTVTAIFGSIRQKFVIVALLPLPHSILSILASLESILGEANVPEEADLLFSRTCICGLCEVGRVVLVLWRVDLQVSVDLRQRTGTFSWCPG
jgi:hypothetical protein